MHIDDGNLFVDDLHWGYRSAWAEASGKIPIAINTRLEKITNRYWSPLLKRGRVIVPANGWYEWTGDKGSKQPWHIHRAGGEPSYLAGLANFQPGSESKALSGFTIVTSDAEGGLLDVHDRRPLVLGRGCRTLAGSISSFGSGRTAFTVCSTSAGRVQMAPCR